MPQSNFSISPESFLLFTQIPLSEEEEASAKLFSTLQLYGLQNLRCAIATSLVQGIAEVRDESDTDYRIKQAYLKGQLDILASLITQATVVSSTQE